MSNTLKRVMAISNSSLFSPFIKECIDLQKDRGVKIKKEPHQKVDDLAESLNRLKSSKILQNKGSKYHK